LDDPAGVAVALVGDEFTAVREGTAGVGEDVDDAVPGCGDFFESFDSVEAGVDAGEPVAEVCGCVG
jgi:hypothetical protein